MKFPFWLPVYGDVTYRNKQCAPESAEQATFFNCLRRDYPELGRVAIHPRNEGLRTVMQTARHKAEGLVPGASDIVIPGKITFVCELKRADHTCSNWQAHQLEYLMACKELGAFVCVAVGHQGALLALKEWLK